MNQQAQSATVQMTNPRADQIVMELLTEPQGRVNPYPLYSQLRSLHPVHHSSLGMWVLSRYADCSSILSSSRLSKDYARQNESRIGPQWRDHVSLTDSEQYMVNLDGPPHERLRRLVNKAFTRQAIDVLRPTIECKAEQLLAPISKAGGADLLEQLAFPLALSTIGDLLGVPPEDQAKFPQLVRDFLAVFETRPSDAQLLTADRAHLEMQHYFSALVTRKRREPGEDFLSQLISIEEDGDRLNDDELWSLAVLLFGAGFETTANQICNGILGLLDHPAELAKLYDDPSLIDKLPDELVRFDGTAQMTVRVAMSDINIDEILIPRDSTILVLLGAANRDPARYATPDRLDVHRTGVRPLSFGGGVHFCLGAALAKTEVELTVKALLSHFPQMALRQRPKFRDRLTLRGLESLCVDVKPN